MRVSEKDIERLRYLSDDVADLVVECESIADRTGIPFKAAGRRYIPEKFYELIKGIDRDVISEIVPHVWLADVLDYAEEGFEFAYTGWIASELC